MADIVRSIAGIGSTQPEDEINHNIESELTTESLGSDSIFSSRAPWRRQYYDDDCPLQEDVDNSITPCSAPYGNDGGIYMNPAANTTTGIYMPPEIDFNAYARKSRENLKQTAWTDVLPHLDVLFRQFLDYVPDRSQVNESVLSLEKAFHAFLEVANSSLPRAYDISTDYTKGVIGEVELHRDYIAQDEHDITSHKQLISVVHRGGRKLLKIMNIRHASAFHLRALMSVLVKEYHMEVDYIPHTYVLQNMGVLRLRYTASTLVLLYKIHVNVRMIGRSFSLEYETRHGWFGMRSVNDFVNDFTRKNKVRKITYRWESDINTPVKEEEANKHPEWSEKLAEELTVVSAYGKRAPRGLKRYNMWYQEDLLGRTIPCNSIILRNEMVSVDVQFVTQIKMKIGETVYETPLVANVLNVFDGRNSIHDKTDVHITLTLPVSAKEYVIEDAYDMSVVTVDESTMRRGWYSYYSDAFIMFTYRVIPSFGKRVLQIFDVRFASDDATFALQTMELLRNLVKDETLLENDKNALLVRLSLFSHIGRVDEEDY
jgi:hypothetical protein